MFGGPYLSKPSAGEIFIALVFTTFAAMVGAGLLGHSEAGLVAGPVLTALYYTYTWPREKPRIKPGKLQIKERKDG